MRIALFSDIHGNYTGLQAVLAAIAAAGGVDLTIAAGDHIGGESGGDDLIELLIAHQVKLIRGDSDTEEKLVRLANESLQAPGSTRHTHSFYLRMQAWYQQHISAEHRALLAALPLSYTVEAASGQRLYVCHASPRAINDRICAPHVDAATVRAGYGAVDAQVIAYGHWHESYVRWLDQRLYLNVASVGFRANGLARFTLLSYQNEQWAVEQHQVPFDLAAEGARMQLRGVPLPE